MSKSFRNAASPWENIIRADDIDGVSDPVVPSRGRIFWAQREWKREERKLITRENDSPAHRRHGSHSQLLSAIQWRTRLALLVVSLFFVLIHPVPPSSRLIPRPLRSSLFHIGVRGRFSHCGEIFFFFTPRRLAARGSFCFGDFTEENILASMHYPILSK